MTKPAKNELMLLSGAANPLSLAADVNIGAADVQAIFVAQMEVRLKAHKTKLDQDVYNAVKGVSRCEKALNKACSSEAKEEMEDFCGALRATFRSQFGRAVPTVSGTLINGGKELLIQIEMSVGRSPDISTFSLPEQQFELGDAIKSAIEDRRVAREELNRLQAARSRTSEMLQDIPAMERQAKAAVAMSGLEASGEAGEALAQQLNGLAHNVVLPGDE